MLNRFIYLLILLTGVLMAGALPKHYEKSLENGLKIVVVPLDNHSQVITTNIFYRVGSRNEVMGKSGIAHMLEHLNFKSSENLKAGEFDEIVKQFGGMTNASTGFDYTHYYIKSSNQNLQKSLELFSELMQNLSLKDEEFQPERNVVAEERRWRTENDPFGYLYFRLFNTAFVYHPYHWTPIGFMADIQNWTIEDIKAFHETYYQPKNAIVVVTGDINPEIVFETTQKLFGHIKNKKDIPLVYQKEPAQDGPRRAEIKKESEVQMVAIAFKTPPFNHQDQLALDVLSYILGSGKSSILNRTIVEEQRLASSIYVRNMDTIDDGVFFMLGLANPNIEAKEVEKSILEQIKQVQAGQITDAEIAKVKKNLLASFVYSIESSSSMASLFGGYYTKGDIAPLMNFEENLQKITKQDIVDVAQRYFVSDNATTVILKK